MNPARVSIAPRALPPCAGPCARRTRRAVRGAAALAFVMLLFFTMSMVSLYTHRHLLLEQRTAVHHQRASQAHEAAEAGLQWLLARLNAGPSEPSCQPSVPAEGRRLRDDLLRSTDPDGQLEPAVSEAGTPLAVTCVHEGQAWQCRCPQGAGPSPDADGEGATGPAFQARLLQAGSRPGIIGVEVVGCTVGRASCLAFDGAAAEHEGRASVSALLAFKPALATAPAAALTARGDVALDEGAPRLVDADPDGHGWTVHAGGTVRVSPGSLQGRPGSPAELTVAQGDARLASASGDQLFLSTFGLPRRAFQSLPTTRTLPCTPVACRAAAVREAAQRHPGHALWLQGDLVIDDAQDLGSPEQPLLMVVTGQVTFDANARLFGLLYVQATGWLAEGSAELHGAVLAEGSVAGRLHARITRSAPVLQALRRSHGWFALVPGSWRDLP